MPQRSVPTLPLPPDATTLRVDAWVDPVVDALGHDPRSTYVERFWLATLGPSTVWLLRHLAERLDAGAPCTIDLRETAHTIGLGRHKDRPPQLLRSIDRSCTFGAARFDGERTLLVRRHLPPLSRRQVQHLPDRLQHEHDAWQAQDHAEPEVVRLRRRARHLALSLLELGESPAETERLLHHWRFHPALAHESVRWATEHRRDEPASSAQSAAGEAPVARS